MRASRLLALLLRLQHQGPTTASVLAEELEVSIRTIYRDISSLQAAGVPLWTETGPGGGIRLLDGWSSRIDGLTADEADALMLSGAPTVASELGLGTVVAAAQAKVMATLPPELRSRAGRVRERFLLDAPGWFQHDDTPEHLSTVADAVWAAERIDVVYRREGGDVRRRLDPLGLVLKGGVWYVVASHRGRPRTYRLSRIQRAVGAGEGFERPRDFDLGEWWAASSSDFDASLLRASVRVRVDGWAERRLAQHVGRTSAEPALAGAPPADAAGWRTLEIRVESPEVAATQLMGLGPHIEVLAPESLRRSMYEAGRQIASRHAPTEGG